MEVPHGGGRRHSVLSVGVFEEGVHRLLVLPEGGRELEAWRPRQLHAWRALGRERLASPRCGTREAAAPQLLEGRFRGVRQFPDGVLRDKDHTIRNDALRVQNSDGLAAANLTA